METNKILSPSNALQRRLKGELENLVNGSIKIKTHKDNVQKLIVELNGTPNSPYDGGIFKILILIPDEYPLVAPEARFLTPIWHPNVHPKTGLISISALEEWTHTSTIGNIMQALTSFLVTPTIMVHADAFVAEQYVNARKEFDEIAKHWCHVFAGGTHVVGQFKVKTGYLNNMGYKDHKALEALSRCDFSMGRTICYLTHDVWK